MLFHIFIFQLNTLSNLFIKFLWSSTKNSNWIEFKRFFENYKLDKYSLFCWAQFACWDRSRKRLLHLCRKIRPHPTFNKCPRYDTKLSDDKAVVLEFWGMGSIFSQSLLSVPLWTGGLVSVRVLSLGQTDINNHLLENICVQKMICIKLNNFKEVAVV